MGDGENIKSGGQGHVPDEGINNDYDPRVSSLLGICNEIVNYRALIIAIACFLLSTTLYLFSAEQR